MKNKALLIMTLAALAFCMFQSALGASDVLDLPGSLKDIGVEAFYGDTSLESVWIPEGVKSIFNRAFANSSLKNVFIPESVTYIASDAFDGCDSIQVFAPQGSYANRWATSNNLDVMLYGTGKVNALPVGNGANDLSFTIEDKGIRYWRDSIDSNRVFAFVAIRNTGTKSIYMDNCSFEYEDERGHLLDNRSWVSSAPDVILPGEVGYFYVSSVNGGYLADDIDLSEGVNLVAKFSLEESDVPLGAYFVFDRSLGFEDTFGEKTPVIRGRVRNNTSEDDSLVYVVGVIKDTDGNVIGIDGTNISDLYAGTTAGFSISMWGVDPSLTVRSIGSYEIIAKPSYYQWK